MVIKHRSLCCYKIFQTKEQAKSFIESAKINFDKTAKFTIHIREVDVARRQVPVFVVVVTDYEASWMRTADFYKVRKDIRRSKGEGFDE